jgi:hypothetical protein
MISSKERWAELEERLKAVEKPLFEFWSMVSGTLENRRKSLEDREERVSELEENCYDWNISNCVDGQK